MQQELTPKQQSVELIKQANHILLVTGKQANNDQLGAMVALDLILKRAGKQVSSIITGEIPKLGKVVDTNSISRDLTGIRDFIIRLDTSQVDVDKLRYELNDNNLEVIVSPYAGNFSSSDASFDYGEYKFDLVIVLGVSQIAKIDTILEQNPTIFDGIHLINIDFHRSNEQYGSVNFIEPNASSVCEMLVGIIESVAQGMIDYHVATALLGGIMSATQGFTGPNTTAKAMTIAAQMISGGAKQQEIVQALFNNSRSEQSSTQADKQESGKKDIIKKEESKQTETIAEKLAKQGKEFTKEGIKDALEHEVLEDEVVKFEHNSLDESQDEQPQEDGDEQSVKKFKNPQMDELYQVTSEEDTLAAASEASKKK